MARHKRMPREVKAEDLPTGRIWKTALYIRLSHEDQEERESMSVQNQREILLHYLDSHAELQLSDIYTDDGYSGTDFDRPDFRRMMADAIRGTIDCILVKDLSRLGRNSTLVGNLIDTVFPDLHIRFIAVYDYLDTELASSSARGLMISIQNAINEDFCRQTSEKIRAVLDMKRRKGEFVGSFAAYGYQKDPNDRHRLLIDREAASVVRDIYQWYAEGLSKKMIADRLNKRKVPSPSLYKKLKGSSYQMPFSSFLWSESTIRRILKNELYTGTMVQGRIRVKSFKNHRQEAVPQEDWYVVEGTHEAIISRELFQKTQELTQRDLRAAPGNTEVYLFSGLLRCGDCGHSMHRKKSGNYVYYICRSYKEYGDCTRHSIRHDILEQAVLTAVQRLISLCVSHEDLSHRLERQLASSSPERQTEREKAICLARLAQLQNRKYSLYEDWKNGDISRDEYRSLTSGYSAEEEQKRQRLSRLEMEAGRQNPSDVSPHPIVAAYQQRKNIPALSREIVVGFIEEIKIFENHSIQIHLKTADPFAASPSCF